MLIGRERAPGHARRRSPGSVAHAVPSSDRTSSAVCGARVHRDQVSWLPELADVCPDCRRLLAGQVDHVVMAAVVPGPRPAASVPVA